MKYRTGVAGFGRTGRAVLDFLLSDERYSSSILLYNDKEPDTGLEKYADAGVKFAFGEKEFKELESCEIIVVSPGINCRTERFEELRKSGVELVSEIEFASRFLNCKIVAVTGTNGKSTTVSLIHHILKECGLDSFLTGNIGTPLISSVKSMNSDSVAVVEVSSFQLEEINSFSPFISVITNITPDHLDRYGSMESYIRAKLDIFNFQTEGSFRLINALDPVLTENSNSFSGRGRTIRFDSSGKSDSEINIREQIIDINIRDEKISVNTEKLRLKGIHNVENTAAAVACAYLCGAEPHDIESSLESFRGLEHRMEFTDSLNGVEFWNDSKATNIDAAIKSLESFSDNLIPVLGGRDKDGDFSLLADLIEERCAAVFLIGECSMKISEQLSDINIPVIDAGGLNDAVHRGYDILKNSGGAVVLAPGCASFDMFENFEKRGEAFKNAVEVLRKELTDG